MPLPRSAPGDARRDGLRRGGSDRGDIVLSWLTRLVVILALVGVACFDALAVAAADISLADEGRLAAVEAGDVWRSSGNLQQTYERAVMVAEQENPLNAVDAKTFRVERDGTVHLRISRETPTLVMHRIPTVRSWADVTREAVGQAPAS